MARGGLKRGTQAWNENLANIQKEQDAERRQLTKGSTALELKAEFGRYNPFQAMSYDKIRENTARSHYAERRRNIRQSMNPQSVDDNNRISSYQKRQAYNRGLVKLKELEAAGLAPYLEKFDERAQKDYDAGEWFRDVTTTHEQMGGEHHVRTITKRGQITLGGMRRMNELMSSPDNALGRPLEAWEAYAYLKFGAPDTAMTEEEQSLEQARTAASGQRQGGRTSTEAAAAKTADQNNSASPWVKKKEEANTIF